MVTLPILKTECSVPSLQNLWFCSLRISKGLKKTVVSVQKGTTMAKGEWMILLVDEVEVMFKNTDKSKSGEAMVVLSAFHQLPLSSLLTPGPSPRPSLLPKPDTGALVFSAMPALPQNFRLKLGDRMKSGLSTAWNCGREVLMLE